MAEATIEEQRKASIGVFDSGVGGLTVLHELLVALPHERFVYLGDTARFPYGTRSSDELVDFAIHNTRELVDRWAKLIVVACNSATAAAGEVLRERFPDHDVITVIGPESQAAAVATRNGRVGLMATPATVASGAYDRALAAADPHLRLTAVPCERLAPIIQAGFPFSQEVVDTVRLYCEPLRAARVDTVILGCTHYPLVRPMLQRMLGPDVTLITPGQAIARRVGCALAAGGLESHDTGEGEYHFLCTGDTEEFRELGSRFLQLPITHVSHIDVHATDTVLLDLPS